MNIDIKVKWNEERALVFEQADGLDAHVTVLIAWSVIFAAGAPFVACCSTYVD